MLHQQARMMREKSLLPEKIYFLKCITDHDVKRHIIALGPSQPLGLFRRYVLLAKQGMFLLQVTTHLLQNLH